MLGLSRKTVRSLGAALASLLLLAVFASASWSASGGANVAAAKAIIAPYVGHAGGFPLKTPLGKRPPASSVLTFMNCENPTCGLFNTLFAGAAKALGVKYNEVATGSNAATITTGFNTAVQQKPSAVLVAGLDPSLYKAGLAGLKAEHVPVIGTAIYGGLKAGFTSVMYGNTAFGFVSKEEAAYTVAHYGAHAKIAFYYLPELSGTTQITVPVFKNEIAKLCPSCTVRLVPILFAAIGTTAPGQIVADLQANPDTTVVVTASSEAFTGAPSALAAAGLHVPIIGANGTPTTLGYLKQGQMTADLSLDLGSLSGMIVDAAARAIVHEPLPAEEAKGIPPYEWLTPKDVTAADTTTGFAAYPNYLKRFAKLWKG